MKYDILSTSLNFRGRSYGEWAGDWWNWVCSEDPDTYLFDDPIVFLRANIDYSGEGEARHQTGTNYYNRIKIHRWTAIFFPIIECGLHYGHPHPYEDRPIVIESEMRRLARKDMDSWISLVVTINDKPLVENINDFRVESPLFKLVVPKNSKLRDRMEVSPEVGTWDAITDGYWILIKSLPIGVYKIHFGGTNKYLSYSGTYDITVLQNS
jgi:hypothetical protein